MTELTFAEKKSIALNILLYFDEVCKTHSFDYYLAYGTLLGAVRHGGFIPWDDDVDVWVPYEIFDELTAVLKGEDKYEVLNGFEGGKWGRPFAKLCDKTTSSAHKSAPGVAIDIFPLFSCGKDDVKKISYYARMMTRTYLYETGHYTSLLKRAVFKMLRMFGKKHAYYSDKLTEYIQTAKGEYYFATSIYGDKDLHYKSDFANAGKEFEGALLNIPSGWDGVLTRIYGNYMQLPPEEKRVAPHDEIFYKND